MPKLELFDETFDRNRAASYELSIQISLNGFSLCVKDQVKQCYVALASNSFTMPPENENDWHPAIGQITTAYDWIKSDFARTTLCFESIAYTFCPQELFEPQKAKQILALIHTLDDLDEIRFSMLPDGLVCIYSIPSMLAGEWLEVKPKTNFYGYCEPLLAYQRLTASSAIVSVSNQLATIALTKSDRLLHCCSMPIQTPEDTTYHLLNISQTLELKPEELEVTLIAIGAKYDEYEPLLSRFFTNIKLYKPWGDFHYSYLLNRYKTRYPNLFIQSLCE